MTHPRLALDVKWSGHVKENTYMRIRAVMQKPWGPVFTAQNASRPSAQLRTKLRRA